MAHTHCNRPQNTLEELSSDVERIFDSLVGRTVGNVFRGGNPLQKFSPHLDVIETPHEFVVSVDLPGVKPEEVQVEVEDGKLTVSGNRETVAEENTKHVHRVERSKGSFHRVVSLPRDIDADRIDARYENGVLHVTLPKSAEKKPRTIEVRTTN